MSDDNDNDLCWEDTTDRPAEWDMYYTKEDLKAAIDAVNSGMTILDAAVKYAVPSRTLEHKVMQLVIAEADCRSDILTERRMTALRRYVQQSLLQTVRKPDIQDNVVAAFEAVKTSVNALEASIHYEMTALDGKIMDALDIPRPKSRPGMYPTATMNKDNKSSDVTRADQPSAIDSAMEDVKKKLNTLTVLHKARQNRITKYASNNAGNKKLTVASRPRVRRLRFFTSPLIKIVNDQAPRRKSAHLELNTILKAYHAVSQNSIIEAIGLRRNLRRQQQVANAMRLDEEVENGNGENAPPPSQPGPSGTNQNNEKALHSAVEVVKLGMAALPAAFNFNVPYRMLCDELGRLGIQDYTHVDYPQSSDNKNYNFLPNSNGAPVQNEDDIEREMKDLSIYSELDTTD